MTDYLKTSINITNCIFNQERVSELINNRVKNKEIRLVTPSGTELHDNPFQK